MDEELEEISKDLGGAENLLKGLLENPSDGPPEEKRVWFVYLSVERSVALLKLHLSIENPGHFERLLSETEGWSSKLATASEALGEARRLLDAGEAEDALRVLRTSRNCLRGFLSVRRRIRLKALRTAKRAKA